MSFAVDSMRLEGYRVGLRTVRRAPADPSALKVFDSSEDEDLPSVAEMSCTDIVTEGMPWFSTRSAARAFAVDLLAAAEHGTAYKDIDILRDTVVKYVIKHVYEGAASDVPLGGAWFDCKDQALAACARLNEPRTAAG